jgi:hypothetical protein
MSQVKHERFVYEDSDKELYEKVESILFSGGTEVEVDGRRYNAARDRDGDDREYFVLTLI